MNAAKAHVTAVQAKAVVARAHPADSKAAASMTVSTAAPLATMAPCKARLLVSSTCQPCQRTPAEANTATAP